MIRSDQSLVSLGDSNEIAQHPVQIHEISQDNESVGKYPLGGEEESHQVQSVLDRGNVLRKTQGTACNGLPSFRGGENDGLARILLSRFVSTLCVYPQPRDC